MHQVEGFVDLFQRHGVGDHRINLNLAVHVPVDDFRHVRAAFRATKGSALPNTASDQLERTGADLGTCGGHTDDDRHAPATVRAFQRVAHHLHVAGSVKAVIHTAKLIEVGFGQLDDSLGDRLALGQLFGVDEIGHTEFAGHFGFVVVQVDADNLVGSGHAQALNDVQTNSAQSEDRRGRADFNAGGVDHRADAGGDTAANVAD